MIVGHQGGWDELLLVLGPILLFAWLLHIANKRATARLKAESEPPPDDAD